MNILMICDEYPPGRHGGVGTAVQVQARQMVKMGHNVVVAGYCHRGYGGEDEFNDNGVKVFRFRQMFASPFFERHDSIIVRTVTRVFTYTRLFQWDIQRSLKQYGKFLNKLIKDYNIDIVEIPDYHDYMRFCYKPVHFPAINAPYVVKLNGSMTYFNAEAGQPTPAHITQMEQRVLNNAEAVAAVSRYTARLSAEVLNYKKDIEIIHNGMHMPEVDTGTPKENGKVIFTGSLVEKKGIFQLMKAWNIVTKTLPDSKLYIYGKGVVAKMKALLEPHAENSVFFKGHVDRAKLNKELYISDVAVFPSYAECFALAPMEAMACGTAVIYSTRTSGPELIEDGKTGLIIDPDDYKGLAKAIIKLIEDKELNAKLAAAGKQHIIDNLEISIIAKQNIDFYLSVLQK